jgi:formylglycine-generating enzyme required for sulfatase activity
MTAPIFVSHSSKDVTRVRSLVASLESRGLTCWISERDIAAGDNYGDAIVDAIERAGVMVLVFSESANNSDEIKKEIALASQRRITVVPVRIEDVAPSKAFRYELATRNWIDLFPNWAEGLGRLSERLATILDAPAVVEIASRPMKSRPTRPLIYLAAGVAAAVLALGVAAATLLPRGPTSQTVSVAERTATSAPTPLPIASVLPSSTPSPVAALVVGLETPPADSAPVAPKPSAAIETPTPAPPSPIPSIVTPAPAATVPSLAPQPPNQGPSPAPSAETALTPAATLPTGIRVGPAPQPPANDPGGEVFKECDECPEMVVIPVGKASLGSPRGELGRDDRNEAEPHEVEISRPFAIGRYAVTVAEWKACVADGGCGSRLPGNMGFEGDRRPVIFVSWNDAQAFVGWLNKKTAGRYRLPGEAEWEFATRGCARQDCDAKPFWFGKITPESAVYDWKFSYDGSPKAYLPLQTETVDWGAPNPFGLYNMLGNVRQWTLDCWNPSPGTARGAGAPVLTGDCSERVTRGGSWNEKPSKLRAGARAWAAADDRTSPNIGFRVLRELTP